jgi:hypothetical protein
MRIGSISALALAAFALAACEGTPTTGSSASNATLNLCGLACPDPALEGDDATPPPPAGDPDDDTNTNTGNTANFTTGDTTIALENAVIKSPAGGSVSKLTLVSGTPNTAKIQINTRTANNGAWPVAKTMEEYEFGTNATGGQGLGADYKEYRILNGQTSDEELQVWNWGASYGTQYREVAGGAGDARRQAWSFGGTKTTNMPTNLTASYSGEYGATSKTWNWVDNDDPNRELSANNTWRVQGTSDLTANFGTSQLTGTLTPTTWAAYDDLAVEHTVGATDSLDPNWTGFMASKVVLNGTITGNTVSGNAKLNPADGWLNGTNPMYAGFFGNGAPNPLEVTGVYNFVAEIPAPIGGEPPINNDRRGFVQQSGVFHGDVVP